MERIKDAQVIDIADVIHICPMAIPFVADDKHPSGFHLSEDESFCDKQFIKMDCAWKLRGRHNLKECIFSNDFKDCPRAWDENIVTKKDKEGFIRIIKFIADCFKLHNK